MKMNGMENEKDAWSGWQLYVVGVASSIPGRSVLDGQFVDCMVQVFSATAADILRPSILSPSQ